MTQPKLSGPDQMPQSGKKPKQIVILLHGLGANGDDLFGLVPYFSSILPDAYFVSPNAPYKCDMAPFGYQWFSLLDRSEENILNGIKEVTPTLNQFIDEKIAEFGLQEKDVALIGFSQGTMLSLYSAPRREKPLAGVLGYSGALVAPHLLKNEIKSKPEVCLVHGEADEIVPFQAFGDAMTALQKSGVTVHGYSREDLGHGIDPEGMKIGQKFLKDVFGG